MDTAVEQMIIKIQNDPCPYWDGKELPCFLDSEGSAHVFVATGVSAPQSHELVAKGVFQRDELRGRILIREALTMSMNSCMDQQVPASPCTPWGHLWKLLISQFPNLKNGNIPILEKAFPMCQAKYIHNC